MIFQTIFMYFIISSSCLIYGIGMKDLLEYPDNISNIATKYVKSFFSVAIAIAIMWLLLRFVLLPYNFQFLFPFLALLLLVGITLLLEHAWSTVFEYDLRDFSLGFLSVFLGMSEGFSLVSSLIIGVSTITSFYLLLLLLYSVNRKNLSVIISPHFNTVSLMLITMACILLAIYGWNVSWLSVTIFN